MKEVKAKILAVAEPIVMVAVPAVLVLCAVFRFDQAALLTFVVAVAAIGVFFSSWEASRPALRQILPTAVLGAVAACGRILFAVLPNFKPVSAICILAGAVFGRRSGFMVGAMAALVSNFFFGQGAWTPWQMYAWGLVGYLAGTFAGRSWFEKRPFLYLYGFLSALLYGFLLNTWMLVGFVYPITAASALATYAAGVPYDLVQAVATVVFLLVIYEPWRCKLKRIKRKYLS